MEETPWLSLAEKYLGEHELAGPGQNNQFILDCFKHTSYLASNDEVPWCAAFMCRILEEAGYKSTNNAGAKSFVQYGTESEGLKPGAIVVIRRKDGGFHVTLCHHVVDEQYVACIGGNQADSVKISVFTKESILAIRWPIKVTEAKGEK